MSATYTMPVLLTSAASIGLFHTLIGVDHSLPFVVLGRARGWSLRRVLAITALCGLGHVLSSVLLGTLGIGLGVALSQLEGIEGSRGELASWLLIGFGLAYALWGWRKRHTHAHIDTTRAGTTTAWSLFIIFVLGPCEPLIPMLMVPALTHGWAEVALVASVFGATTLITMLAVVSAGYQGLGLINQEQLTRHAHLLAGLSIAGAGGAIQLFGI